MTKLSKSVLEKIKENDVKPKPRWQFIAERVGFWTLFILSVFIGGMATGIIFHELLGTEWGFLRYIAPNRMKAFFIVLPYVWIGILGLVLFLAYKTFYKTKKGYKYHSTWVIGLSVLLSLILGFISYQSHASHRFEEMMHHVGTYAQIEEFRGGLWVNPENGILMGEIERITSDTTFTFYDMREGEWVVDFAHASLFEGDIIGEGERAFIIGNSEEEGIFKAEQIKIMGDDHPLQMTHKGRMKGGYERKPMPML